MSALLKLPFYYGWVVLGMMHDDAGSTQPFRAVVLRPMTEEFGWSCTEVTTAISLGTIGFGFVGPFAGRLADRFGPRVLVPAGGVLLSVAFFALAGVNALWQFYVAYIRARSIASPRLTGVSAQTAMVNWFANKCGQARLLESRRCSCRSSDFNIVMRLRSTILRRCYDESTN